VQTYFFHLRDLLEPDRARGAGSGVLVRVGDYQRNQTMGALLSQVWVK
jgi:hypothetical protein